MHFSYRENKYEQEREPNSLFLLFGFAFSQCVFHLQTFARQKRCASENGGRTVKNNYLRALKIQYLLALQILFLVPEAQGNVAEQTIRIINNYRSQGISETRRKHGASRSLLRCARRIPCECPAALRGARGAQQDKFPSLAPLRSHSFQIRLHLVQTKHIFDSNFRLHLISTTLQYIASLSEGKETPAMWNLVKIGAVQAGML